MLVLGMIRKRGSVNCTQERRSDRESLETHSSSVIAGLSAYESGNRTNGAELNPEEDVCLH